MNRFVFWALAIAVACQPRLAFAQDNKEAFKTIKIEGKLTDDDKADPIIEGAKHKVHSVKLEGGKVFRIDLRSNDFDSFLRLQDEGGKTLAQDDDSGGFPHARIIYKVEKPGNFKLVVTSYDRKLGAYDLTINEATGAEALLFKAMNLATLGKDKKGEVAEVVNEAKKYLVDQGPKLGRQEMILAATLCRNLEQAAPELAAAAYTDLGNILVKSEDKMVASFAAKFIGSGRRLNLPGKEMDVKGLMLDGKEFDWKAYRGKVVLVDFWATWCGPCIGELPNVLKNYEAYKDRGFTVVGVSLDRNRDALDKFIENRKIPWVCLFEKEAKDQFWDHPLARHYGVMSIPLAILVDRDGKVISMRARGPELTRLLEKHIGEKDKSK